MSKKKEFMKATQFLRRLKATVESLPTEEEKQIARAQIAALADFLRSLQATIDAMPSIESVGHVNEAIAGLLGLFAKAEANPVLAGLAPAPRKPRPRKPPRALTDQDLATGKSDVEGLKAMSVADIRAKLLSQDGYPLSRLRGMAGSLGIGAAEKLSRESLAHQITTKIANYRGYQTLSGKDGGQQTADKL